MTESLSTQMDRLADAVTNTHFSVESEGISVDVQANGHVIALEIDDASILDSRRLGPLIAELINEARDRAQAQVEDLVTQVQADPRVATIVEQLSDTPERSLPYNAQDQWDEDYQYRPKSQVFDE
ncbi:YbaB/EbfC family nucleoid-associated protein [Nocardia sp. NPDC020380]|uniref:YbaB/EbfC family nucleoid-associated protein n=1 Tax=Nocardia sp. NPDC020380 TaxID=3364309 RepID=UPI0037964459